MIHIHTADIAGEVMLRLELTRNVDWTAGNKTTGDFTRFRFYVAEGARYDKIGEWDSRTDSIKTYEPYPLIDGEIVLKKGQVVFAVPERNGSQAPSLLGFSVQPTIQFRGA